MRKYQSIRRDGACHRDTTEAVEPEVSDPYQARVEAQRQARQHHQSEFEARVAAGIAERQCMVSITFQYPCGKPEVVTDIATPLLDAWYDMIEKLLGAKLAEMGVEIWGNIEDVWG